ncbi:MAG: serine acetyltransferase [Bacteroidetes bacterium]|nr:serine acetyltransferase [Bacteroidota bacterium]
MSPIQSDLYRYTGRYSMRLLLRNLVLNPGFRFTFFLRKLHACPRWSPMRLVYKFLHRRYTFKYGIQIAARTVIGDGLCIRHFGAIVINPRVRIGRNCNIHQGVTLGQTNRGSRQGSPVIGDSVWMGANAVIVGGIKVGNNVLIAPNSYVNFDVPDNSLVMGNPATVQPRDNATEGYINNKV